MDIRIEKIILFIAKNFRIELVLEDLANEVNLSKFHFQKLFKKETGQTPLHYINKARLEHAVHYLAIYPDSLQTDIAFECGYSSPAVFTRSFKQYYKVSPSIYKKEFLQRNKINKQNYNQFKLPITYLNRKIILIYPSNLLKENLLILYKKLVSKIDKPTNSFGVYIDTPIHKSLEECRYYAGLEDSNKIYNTEASYEIEDGFYTYFDLQGDFKEVSEQIISFKQDFIDNSPYQISSLIGFEKIKLPVKFSDFDYFSVKRTLFIKIKRK